MPSGLERRHSRSVQEAKAFRAIQVGAVTAVGFVISTLLWIVGAFNDHPALVFLIATILCAVRFGMVTGTIGANRRR